MRRFRKTIRKPETLGRKKRAARDVFDVTMDLHGYTSQEALRDIEEELLSAEASSILVIHGKGNGILRRSIRSFLAAYGNGIKVEYGELENLPGGDGVTAVYLN